MEIIGLNAPRHHHIMDTEVVQMPKAYSYIRMSTDIQLKGDSLRRQKEETEKYCKNHGLQLTELIEDIGTPAFRGQNALYGKLSIFLALVQKGEIEQGSYLIVESLDRLSRDNVLSAFSQFTNLLEHGITIVTLMDQQVYTKGRVTSDFGSLFLSLGAMLRAHDESKTKSKRVGAAWEQKRLNAPTKAMTAMAPAWLRLNKETKIFEIDEAKAAVVEFIFEAAKSNGYIVITKQLNAQKIPCFGRSKFWHPSYVKKILRGRAVLGEFHPHKVVDGRRVPEGDVIQGYYPAIISEELFYEVQASISARQSLGGGRKGNTVPNLFQHLATCGHCGSPMHYVNKGKKAGQVLICSKRHSGGSCNARGWSYTRLERAVFEFITDINLSAILSSDLSTPYNEAQRKLSALQGELTVCLAQQQKNLDAWQVAPPNVQDLLTGVLSKDQDRLTEIADQIERTKGDLVSLSKRKLDEAVSGVEAYETIVDSSLSEDDAFALRSKISSQLKSVVKRIQVFTDYSIFPWEIEDDSLESDFIDEDLKNELQTKGIFSGDDIQWNEAFEANVRRFQQQILVTLANGKILMVKPASKKVLEFNKSVFG